MRLRYSRVRRSCSWKLAAATPRDPMPRSAASSSVPGVVTVTHIGGWGTCTGLGSTGRSGIETVAPWWDTRSSVHSRGRRWTYSSHEIFVVSGSTPKPPSSVHVDARAVPNSSRPPERMSRTAARSATRIGWFICGTHTTAPWPTRIRCGLHRHRGEEQLRRRAVRVLLEEVVLDGPHRVEAELVRQSRLLESVAVHRLLVALARAAGAPTARRRCRTSRRRLGGTGTVTGTGSASRDSPSRTISPSSAGDVPAS